MKHAQHTLFPIKLHCVHCERYLDLWDHQHHVEVLHPRCESCHVELRLSEAMMTDMRVAIQEAVNELVLQ